MKRLVSPEDTLFLVPDRQSLDGIITRRGLDPVHAGNLRQLCDFVSIGADGRSGAKQSGDWCLFIAADSSKDTQQVRSPRRLITLSHSNVHSSHPELTSPAMYLLRLALSLCHPTTTRSIAVHPARRRSAQSSPQFPMSGRSDARGTCTP